MKSSNYMSVDQNDAVGGEISREWQSLKTNNGANTLQHARIEKENNNAS